MSVVSAKGSATSQVQPVGSATSLVPPSVSAKASAASAVSAVSAVVPTAPRKFVTCPGNNLRWNLTAAEILQMADTIIARSKAVHDFIGALKPTDINYNNVLMPLAEDATYYYTARLPLHFVQHVFANKELKLASIQAEKKLLSFDDEISMREDVFKILMEAQTKFGETLRPEAKRYLERLIIFGQRNGLHLSKDIQKQITEINKSMTHLSANFVNNLTENNTLLKFTSQELDGLPLDVLKTMKQTTDGRYKVTLTGSHYMQCMKYVNNADTRMKLETAFNSRSTKENTFILENLIKLRHTKARLLSYQNHTSYVLDNRMAKTPERVTAFLYDLQTKLQTLMEDDIRLFLQYKRDDCQKLKRQCDNKINLWDTRYYMTRVEERKYAVDHNKLREYFPLHVVRHGLLEIYQEFLGLKFELIEGAEVWHPSVTLYSTKDKITDALIGYFYLDLSPRGGKYGQAACFCLQPVCLLGNGTRQVGIAALVANFTPPVNEKPALLTHDEVETFFHEFGHVMHQLCSETEFVIFSGANVEKDFVEAPSQMLENWCWEREPLARMSAHYTDGSAIPNDLLNALVNSRRANGGILTMWQILLSKFDQAIHSTPEANTIELFEDMSKKIIGIAPIKGTSTPATFTHMACGFDAQYYAYLWSEVFSSDMFSRCKKDGLRNPKVGIDYRSMILRPGGSMDADKMIRAFLGRDLQPAAFFAVKGFNP